MPSGSEAARDLLLLLIKSATRINTLNYIKITAARKSQRYRATLDDPSVTRRFLPLGGARWRGGLFRPIPVWAPVIIPNVRRLLAAYRTIDGDAGKLERTARRITNRNENCRSSRGGRQAGQLWVVTADRQEREGNERTDRRTYVRTREGLTFRFSP